MDMKSKARDKPLSRYDEEVCQLLDYIDTIEAEVEALREDKARLDWLEATGFGVHRTAPNRWLTQADSVNGETVRAAIDAARSAEREEK